MMTHRISDVFLLYSLVLIHLAQVCPAKLPDPPPRRSRLEIEGVLAKAQKVQAPGEFKQLNVVLVADKKDHGPCEHDYPLWQKRWQSLLSGSSSGPVNLYGPAQDYSTSEDGTGRITVKRGQGWPDKEQFAWADVIVVFCYIEWDEYKLKQLQAYLNRGGGFVLVHSATWTKPRPSQRVAETTGCGGFTQYRHGPLNLRIVDPNHLVCFGLPTQIAFVDESYWPPTPIIPGNTMHVLATSNEKLGKDVSGSQAQPMFWTYAYGKGRVLGCVPGHYTWTFDDPYFRLLLLRGMLWSARQWPFRLDSLAFRGIALKD
jgi:type 1 glutamine amidotransferase